MSTVAERLHSFSSLLGWSMPRRYCHTPTDNSPRIVWYECGYPNVMLRISQSPRSVWRACVHAMRYRIVTHLHEVELSPLDQELQKEAIRLSPYLARIWFETRRGRRLYRALHPSCCNYTVVQLRTRRQVTVRRDGSVY